MKLRSLALVAVALFLPLAATACSDDSTGDLDKKEVTDKLVEQGMDKEVADCLADAIIAADFTEDELDSMNSGGDDVDSKKVAAYTEDAMECATAAAGTGGG